MYNSGYKIHGLVSGFIPVTDDEIIHHYLVSSPIYYAIDPINGAGFVPKTN